MGEEQKTHRELAGSCSETNGFLSWNCWAYIFYLWLDKNKTAAHFLPKYGNVLNCVFKQSLMTVLE